MNELAKKVLDDRIDWFSYAFDKLMNNPVIKSHFEMMSMHQKAEILGHATNGLLIGIETQMFFKGQNK